MGILCRMMLWIALLAAVACLARGEEGELTCSVPLDLERDPALKEMTYDIGDGEKTTWVYVEPDVKTFYKDGSAPASTRVVPKHNGFSGKFINLSNKKLALYWEDRPGGKKHLMRIHDPFGVSGTATFPSHRFLFTPVDDPDNVLHTFVVGDYPENVYSYDPYFVENDPVQTEANLAASLTKAERVKYDGWRKTLRFNEQYKAFTGRSYLANYLRDPPMHFMWRADYFGQEHWITSKETRFTKPVPEEDLQPILATPKERRLAEPAFQDYREPGVFNMTLKVLSCAPRAFEIPDFLSSYEVEHILYLASGIDLKKSTTGAIGTPANAEDTRRTRTSFNSWVPREKSPIVDAIYRRAADLMRIDEALLRRRGNDERPDMKTKQTISEHLQLVHYGITQEYTAHHDFGFSRIDNTEQGARFATLLLYLNEGMKGGETSFPRWVNAESFQELKIVPKVGKAVLFYSQLPDGNLDDFSHHAAKPITDGEKWLINLWTWSPVYRGLE